MAWTNNETSTGTAGSAARIAGGVGTTVASASSITVSNFVTPISGTATINTITGAVAGEIITLVSLGGFSLGTSGNITGITTPVNVGTGESVMLAYDGTSYRLHTGTPINSSFFVYNVKGYGARTDGTDARASINSAIAAATGGGIVYFPPGTYTISDALTVATANVTLLGAGKGASIITNSTSGKAGLNVTASGVTVRDLTIKTKTNGDGAGGLVVGQDGIDADTVDGLTVRDCEITQVGRWGVYLINCTNSTVVGNDIHDFARAAVFMDSGSYADISHNTVYDCTGTTGNPYGIQLSILDDATLPYPKYVTVAGNNVRGVRRWDGINAHGGQFLVFADNVVTDCRVGMDITLDKASASSGYGVLEDVTIVGNTCRGTDNGTSIDMRNRGIWVGGEITAMARRVTITGNAVSNYNQWDSNSAGGAAADGGGIHVTCVEGCVITGNTVQDNVECGLVLYTNCRGVRVTGNTFKDNYAGTSGAALGCGIRVSSGCSGEITNNTIRSTSLGTAWATGTAYAVNDIVIPTGGGNGYRYRCTTAGTSHGATEPTWPTDANHTVADNTVTWTCDGPENRQKYGIYAGLSSQDLVICDNDISRNSLSAIVNPTNLGGLDRSHYAGKGTATFKPSGVITKSVAVVGNDADTNEKVAWTYSLPANTLANDGESIRITATGYFAANGDTKRVKVYFGATQLVSVATTSSGTGWSLTATCSRTSATAQVGHGAIWYGTSVATLNGAITPAETLTGAVTVKIGVKDDTAATANSIVVNSVRVEYLP